MKNLKQTKNLYKCFGSIEKLRIWNLLLQPMSDVLIPSDCQKALGISSGVFVHFREFVEAGLVSVDLWGKRKVYFFADQESKEFVSEILSSVNDVQLERDWLKFQQLRKGGFLQISQHGTILKNGHVKIFPFPVLSNKVAKNWLNT